MNIGIDLGGSHVGVGLIETGNILAKKEKDLEFCGNDMRDIIVETIHRFIDEILNENGAKIENIDFIGISSPGVAKNNIIYNVVNLGIEEFRIGEMLKSYYNVDIRVKNDAKCAAIAEFNYGCMKDYKDGIFLTLGTGIGGAAFINNQLIESNTFPGTEFGHMVIQKDGRECKCGNHGCFEKYASMKVLKQEVKDKYKLENDTTSEEIVNIIKDDIEKEKMSNIVNNYVSFLAIGISNLVNIFEPEIIGLGGSVVYLEDIIVEKVKAEIIQKDLLFNKRNTINIQIATLGNDAGMIGATCI